MAWCAHLHCICLIRVFACVVLQAGQEDGVGMFTFRDGSTYEGFWHTGKKHGVGVFRPAPGYNALKGAQQRCGSSSQQKRLKQTLVRCAPVLLRRWDF